MQPDRSTKDPTSSKRILRRLATLHRVYGCLVAVVGIFLMCALWVSAEDADPTARVGLGPFLVPELAVLIGVIVAVWSYVVLLLWAGECLANTKYYGYCIAFACLNCLYLPVGTILGPATLLILSRRRFRVLFRPPGLPTPIPANPPAE